MRDSADHAGVHAHLGHRGPHLRPLRHESRPHGRLHAPLLFRPCRGLRSWCVFHRLDPASFRLAAADWDPCRRCRVGCDCGSNRLGMHQVDRRVVRHADPCIRATWLRYALSFQGIHRWLGWNWRNPAPGRSVRARLLSGQGRLFLPCHVLPSCVVCSLQRARHVAVWRRAGRHPRKRGHNARAYKIAVVVVAYGLGSLAGALYTPFAGFVAPELFFWLVSGRVLIMVVVGGAGTLIGPIIGGAFFLILEHQLSEVIEFWPLIFGTVFIAFVLLAPEGIWGLVRKYARSEPPAPDAEAPGAAA